jgi:hypothetical protein
MIRTAAFGMRSPTIMRFRISVQRETPVTSPEDRAAVYTTERRSR